MKTPVQFLIAAAFATLTLSGFAAAPSDDYNFAGATHNLQCIALNKSNVQLCDASGNPLGLVANNRVNSTCGNSSLRFQGMEAITAGNGRTYYYCWGLGGSDGQSGHIWISDMTARPSIDPNARGGSGGLFNGRSAPDVLLADGVTKKSYFINPQVIPTDMGYFGPSDGVWRSFANYSEPAAPFAGNNMPLCWSWVNKGGGGLVRAQMLRNEVFYPSDVSTITMTTYNSSHVANGSIKAMYGSIWNGSTRLYGWIVHSFHYGTQYTELITCRTCN